MALNQRKYERKHTDVLRDIRPLSARIADWLKNPTHAALILGFAAGSMHFFHLPLLGGDFILIAGLLFFWWLAVQDRALAFKMPYGAKWKDKNNDGPGKNGRAEGILYLGNVKDTNEEVWFTNSDARTHILYLGTTGAGKTEGLKSMVSNALTWGSGFVYIDGKADTDLWSSLSSLVRRFGRDDDLLVLNYMTGNSDTKAPSNTMNPFSSGSASYLTNMLVSLMPDAEGDNAMWKERAVSLIGSLMPALTWRRDHLDIPVSVGTIRDFLSLNNIIKISRDESLPEDIRHSLKGYLDTLPGYIAAAFDDDGNEKPAGPDQPMYDTTTPRQQHGYLSMQFTRALQSLADDYGYIFDTQAADVDMVDVVLNRRILVVLIPALEKSSDETANLGKIVAATIKGMMGSTLGATVEGDSATVIENKPTQSATPFMTVFDEVGYYAAQGMAVMAAQARSLGFCLVYSAQDLPAMEKRVREEARSITANCNIKIFGKLEDPTQTKEFFEKTVGSALVIEASGFQTAGGSSKSYFDTHQASLQVRPRASYDALRGFKEGMAVIAFGEMVCDTQIFYSNPGFAKAMRVTRFVALPPPDENLTKHASTITKLRDLMVHKTWTALKADVAIETPEEIKAMQETFDKGRKQKLDETECGMAAIAAVFALNNPLPEDDEQEAAAPPPPPQKTQDAAATAPPPQQKAPSAPRQPAPEEKEPPAAASGNPMSFFSKKPAAPADSTTTKDAAPPPTAPVQTITPKAPVDAEPAQSTDQPGTSAPGTWEEIMAALEKEDSAAGDTKTSIFEGLPEQATPGSSAPPAAEPSVSVSAADAQLQARQLDPEAERILRQAGENAARSIFKSRKDEESDAAE